MRRAATLRAVIGRELAEAVRYARLIEAHGSDDQGTWPGGDWYRATSLPQVYDANRVVVLERGFAMPVEEVSAAADEIQAALPNRIVEFVSCAEFGTLGGRVPGCRMARGAARRHGSTS